MKRYREPVFSRTVDTTRCTAVSVEVQGEELVTVEKEVTLFGHVTKEEAKDIIGCQLIKGGVIHESAIYKWNLKDIMPLGTVAPANEQ